MSNSAKLIFSCSKMAAGKSTLARALAQRLSASVDAELIEAGEDAVARGRFDSVSAWVNEALRLKVAHDRRLEALATFVAAYEAEHGEITSAEMHSAARGARAGAIAVRGMRAGRVPTGRRRGRVG